MTDVQLFGKLVCKHIFKKYKDDDSRRKTTILNLLMLTEAGELIEVKSYNERVAYTVYRKVQQDESYVVRYQTCELRKANSEYSCATLEIPRRWWIEPCQDITPKKSIPSTVELSKAIDMTSGDSPRPVTLVGVFRAIKIGPYVGPVINEKPLVQGYFVYLNDLNGRQYNVLVWRLVRVDRRKDFRILDAQEGDIILIPACRASSPGEKKKISFTTCYPPLVNSDCVSHRRVSDLKQFQGDYI